MSKAHDQLTPSRTTTKQAQAATTTTKTKITNFIFIKKLKAGCVVMVPFARLTINGQVESKRKKGETSPTNLDNDFDFVDTVLMGLDSMDGAVLKGPDDVTNPFDFNL
jgi:hypothetical protein